MDLNAIDYTNGSNCLDEF